MKVRFAIIFVFAALFLLPVFAFAGVIQVPAGDNQIDNALAQASAGDTLVLITDGGLYHETLTAVIDIPLVIRAADGLTQKPVWYTDSGRLVIQLQNDLVLEGIRFDGAKGDSLTAKCIQTGDSVDVKWDYNLIVRNCDFVNFDNGVDDGHAIYGNSNTQADTVLIDHSYFAHIRQEAVRFKAPKVAPGSVKHFFVRYSTFWDIGDEAVYVQDHDSNISTPGPEFVADHLTVVKAGSKSIYPKYLDGAVIKNSIVAYSGTDEYACRIYGPNSAVHHFLFYQCPKGISKHNNAVNDTVLVLKNQNPYFADPENGNFAVPANSPAAVMAEDSTAIGDTTWGVYDGTDITRWELVENRDWGRLIKGALTDGDTLMFVTDGGDYYAPHSVSLPPVSLVWMSKPGLSKRPLVHTAFGQSRVVKVYGPIKVIGLRFKGDGVVENGTPYLFRFDAGGENFGTVVFENCDFGYIRLRAIHGDKNNRTDSLLIHNSTFHDIGESGMRYKYPSQVGYAKIWDSSFWNIGENAIYIKDTDDTLIVSHCTFFRMDGKQFAPFMTRSEARAVYGSLDSLIVVRDNIFARCDAAVKVWGENPVVEYNLFWLNKANIVPVDDSTLTFPIFNFEDDPMFKDTTAIDLALNENSPAIGAASDGSNLGDPRWGTWTSTAVAEQPEIPGSYRLGQNYPNPFNPETVITYDLPKASAVKLEVYNLLGLKIATLYSGKQGAGHHTIVWNGRNDAGQKVPSGVYIYRLEAGNFHSCRKMVLMK